MTSRGIDLPAGAVGPGLPALIGPEFPPPADLSAATGPPLGAAGNPGSGPGAVPPEHPSLFGAAFGLDNDVVAALDLIARPQYPLDPDHNPLDIIAGSHYEAVYLDRFLGSRSEAETRAIMARIDREEADRRRLAGTGVAGILAHVAAGIASPTTLIPVGGWLGAAARTGRAARIGLTAAETAGVAAAAVGAQEAVLQAGQETRTLEESFYNVAGAAIIGGLLGGAVGAFSRGAVDELAGRIRDIPATREEEAALYNAGLDQSLGAAGNPRGVGSGEAASALGAEKALRFQGPQPRLKLSPNIVSRQVVRDLAEDPNSLAENAEGIATSVGGSAESRAKTWGGPLFEVVRQRRAAFSDYAFGRKKTLAPARAALGRVTGGAAAGKLSYAGFKEQVAWAALHNDAHDIPQVAAAAAHRRTTIINPLRDKAMTTIEGFRELVDLGSADLSYLTRIWNTTLVSRHRGELTRIIAQWMRGQGDDFTASLANDAELDSLAGEVVDSILGHSQPTRLLLPGDVRTGPRGPLKERTLRDLPTALVWKFVEKDVDRIDRFYVRTLAADAALAEKFGGKVDLESELIAMRQEAAKMARDKSPAEAERIEKRLKKDMRDVIGIRDRIRGTYGMPADPDAVWVRAAQVLRDVNYLRLLGGMTLSAIPDLSRPVMVHGLTRTLRTIWHPLVHGLSSIRLAARDVRLANAGNDLLSDERLMAINDIMDGSRYGTAIERGASYLTNRFGFVSLMAPWNAWARQFVGIITQTRMLQAIGRVAEGAASKKEIAYLAAGGIDDLMAGRIWRQFAGATRKGRKIGGHGRRDGDIWWGNTELWDDRQAVDAYRAFIIRDVDRTILVPGQEKPLWMSTELGKVIGQFKTFNVAAAQRTLVAGLEQRDAAAAMGAMFALGLGAFTYWLKTQAIAGYTPPDNPAQWAVEAADRSGLLGWVMDVNGTVERLTGGVVGASALTGQTVSRYRSQQFPGAAFGPTFDLLQSMGTVSSAAFRGDMTATDIHVARKLLPLENLFYLRRIFDSLEDKLAESQGLPPRRGWEWRRR